MNIEFRWLETVTVDRLEDDEEVEESEEGVSRDRVLQFRQAGDYDIPPGEWQNVGVRIETYERLSDGSKVLVKVVES